MVPNLYLYISIIDPDSEGLQGHLRFDGTELFRVVDLKDQN